MSLKVKLTSAVLSFMLILGLMIMGVFASSTATINLGGNLSFSASNVHARVAGGSIRCREYRRCKLARTHL